MAPKEVVTMAEQVDGALIATVPKNSREEVRIVRKLFEGHDLVDARVWALSLVPGGDASPTKKGLCLRPETWAELCEKITEALGGGE
jgi:hypothetical protein